MGLFDRLKSGLSKTRDSIVGGIDSVFSSFSKIDDDFYDELEETLIMGDIGVRATDEILEDLRAKVKEEGIRDPKDCKQLLINSIKEKMDLGPNAYDFENQRSIVMLIGVNGVGKTTSVGKLAGLLRAQNKKVVMAAADTFRAAAIEQLTEWSKRTGADIIAQTEGSDPAAVIYDAIQASHARNADVLLCDTAGRLHNKKNLMAELQKIDKVISREAGNLYRENLIVLDATTGQNALSQLREFKEVTDITGIILTKMDGTAKGGIAVAIQAELGIPVKYIGVGEQVSDLQKFNSETFVNALFDLDSEDDKDDDLEEEINKHLVGALNSSNEAQELESEEKEEVEEREEKLKLQKIQILLKSLEMGLKSKRQLKKRQLKKSQLKLSRLRKNQLKKSQLKKMKHLRRVEDSSPSLKRRSKNAIKCSIEFLYILNYN